MLPLVQLMAHYWQVFAEYMHVHDYGERHDYEDPALARLEAELTALERYIPPEFLVPF